MWREWGRGGVIFGSRVFDVEYKKKKKTLCRISSDPRRPDFDHIGPTMRRPTSPTRCGPSTFILVRHGVTKTNVHLGRLPPGLRYGDAGFTDPLHYDTTLTPEGIRQAKALARSLAGAGLAAPCVVLASPLTRALHTASLAFPGHTAMASLPLASERLWLASDVGAPRPALEAAWPHVDHSALPQDSPWWHGGDAQLGLAPGGAVLPETDAQFADRMAALRASLLALGGADVVALVSHAGVLAALTGRTFANAERAVVSAGELERGGVERRLFVLDQETS